MKKIKITSLFPAIVMAPIFPNSLKIVLLLIVGVALLFWLLFRFVNMQKEIGLLKEEIHYFMDSFQDIRIPVSMVQAQLANVRGDNCPESIRNATLLVKRNIDFLDGHLAKLMNLKQLFTHAERVELTECELGYLLRSRICALREYAANKHVKLELQTKFSYGSVWLDLSKVSPVIDRFIKNAIDYVESESCITMLVSLFQEHWVIDITNAECDKLAKCYCCEKPRLFAHGTTTQEYSFAKSPLCKQLMELCGGKIRINLSNRIVSLQFPVECSSGKMPQRIVKPQIAACCEEEVIDACLGKRKQKRSSCKPVVVLVDSNEEFRLYLAARLSDDFIVKGFSSGAEALAHIKEDHPDVVVCDTVLHEMNGDELSSRLKTSRDTAIIPVILYCSQVDTDRRFKREASLADLFLQGSVQVEDLKIEISILIRNNRSLRKGFLLYVFGENFVVNGGYEDGEAYIQKVKDFITKNIGEKPLTVDDIVKEMGTTRTAFYTKWKALTGEYPSLIISRIRMEKGRELLESGLYKIHVIPEKIGMKDVPYFSAEFKKYYKMTPTEWMKKYNRVLK